MKLEKYIKKQLRESFSRMEHQDEIDALLDKVSAQGIESLSSSDRFRLKSVRDENMVIEDAVEYLDSKFENLKVESKDSPYGLANTLHYFYTASNEEIMMLREPSPTSKTGYVLFIKEPLYKECNYEMKLDYEDTKKAFNQWISNFVSLEDNRGFYLDTYTQ